MELLILPEKGDNDDDSDDYNHDHEDVDDYDHDHDDNDDGVEDIYNYYHNNT